MSDCAGRSLTEGLSPNLDALSPKLAGLSPNLIKPLSLNLARLPASHSRPGAPTALARPATPGPARARP